MRQGMNKIETYQRKWIKLIITFILIVIGTYGSDVSSIILF